MPSGTDIPAGGVDRGVDSGREGPRRYGLGTSSARQGSRSDLKSQAGRDLLRPGLGSQVPPLGRSLVGHCGTVVRDPAGHHADDGSQIGESAVAAGVLGLPR